MRNETAFPPWGFRSFTIFFRTTFSVIFTVYFTLHFRFRFLSGEPPLLPAQPTWSHVCHHDPASKLVSTFPSFLSKNICSHFLVFVADIVLHNFIQYHWPKIFNVLRNLWPFFPVNTEIVSVLGSILYISLHKYSNSKVRYFGTFFWPAGTGKKWSRTILSNSLCVKVSTKVCKVNIRKVYQETLL